MLNPEAITTKLLALPILSEYDRPRLNRDRYWEGNTLGGHFHFFGCTGELWDPMTGDIMLAVGYKLHVSGSDQSKTRIAAAFIEVLGEPRRNVREEMKKTMGKQTNKYTTLTWFQPEDETVPNRARYAILTNSSAEAYLLHCLGPATQDRAVNEDELGPVLQRFLTSGSQEK